MPKIILASASERRKQLLAMIGLDFKVVVSGVEEKIDSLKNPFDLVKKLSSEKAQDTAAKCKDSIVIGADTIVVVDNKILGKPQDESNATKMLTKLGGRMHKVITGFTIVDSKTEKQTSEAVATKVYFKALSQKEINSYIQTEKPYDYAGAYAIQGKAAIFVEKIDGDFFNVVGLPVFSLVDALREFKIFVDS